MNLCIYINVTYTNNTSFIKSTSLGELFLGEAWQLSVVSTKLSPSLILKKRGTLISCNVLHVLEHFLGGEIICGGYCGNKKMVQA